MSIKNIEHVFSQIDKTDYAEGLDAYPKYRATLRDLSQYYGVPFCQTVAAFCALSPNNDYTGNLRSLVSLIQGVLAKRPPEAITVSTYKACRDRAYLYLTGDADFLVETKGPKTRAFYHNILKPYCPKHITLDGHMYGVYIGKRVRMTEAARLGWDTGYDKIAADFKKVAKAHGILPNQLQAMLWMTWKRLHDVVYKRQPSLLHSHGDTWQTYRRPDSITPFTGNSK